MSAWTLYALFVAAVAVIVAILLREAFFTPPPQQRQRSRSDGPAGHAARSGGPGALAPSRARGRHDARLRE